MGDVLVTGATGTVGAAVLEHLLDRGAPAVAAIRRPSDTSRLPPDVRTRELDFERPPDDWGEVLDGVDRIFLMRPPQLEDVARFLLPLVDAAEHHGVRQIAFLSLQGAQWNRRAPHHAVERHLRDHGIPHTLLRPNFFMQNLAGAYAADIRVRNEISVPAGRSFTAFVDARDVGEVAATVLTEPGHLGRAYTLSGEHSLTYRSVARLFSDVLHRSIRYARPTEASYLARLTRDGHPADYVDVQRMIYRIVRLNASAVPNRAVRRLTGHPATSMRRFIEDYRQVWAV